MFMFPITARNNCRNQVLSRRLIALLLMLPLLLLSRPLPAALVWETTEQHVALEAGLSEVTANFAFHNAGNTTVTIRRLRSNCNCNVAELPKLPKYDYAPGESGNIDLSLPVRPRQGLVRAEIIVLTDAKPAAAATRLVLTVDTGSFVDFQPSAQTWNIGGAATMQTTWIQIWASALISASQPAAHPSSSCDIDPSAPMALNNSM